MTIYRRLLQAAAAAAVAVVPWIASAQSYPVPAGAPPTGPYTTGYPYVSAAYPIAYPNEAWQRAVGGTPLDPYATTVQVVPPQGGTVMLYRDGRMKGWWLSPSAITVRPGQVYGVVATRGTSVLYNAAMVFRPGVTSLTWSGERLPAIAYAPSWGYDPYGYGPGRGAASGYRHAAHPARAGGQAPVAGSKPRAGTSPAAETSAASLPSGGVAVSPRQMRQRIGKVRARKVGSSAVSRPRPAARPSAHLRPAKKAVARGRAPQAKPAARRQAPPRGAELRARPAPSQRAAKPRATAHRHLVQAIRAQRTGTKH